MATAPLFEPVQPMRTPDWVPVWRGFFGERLRNTIYGWPEPAFDADIRTRRVLGFTVHIVSQPAAVERVLLGNKANYERPGIARRILSPLVGNGLLSAEGEDWRKQRRIVAPTFAPGAVAAMAPLMDAAAKREVADWPQRDARLDLAQAATRTTMAIIADALFGGDARLCDPAGARHIETLLAAAGQARFMTMLGLQELDPSPGMRRARVSRAWLRKTLSDLVRERGPEGGGDDFFGGLIRALHGQFTPDEAVELAVDNAITFFVAGHETTANALAWTIYCLAAQPALQDEARSEAVAALALPVAERAAAMPLLHQILEESMRLYPPAPRFDREALAGDVLSGVNIAKGDLISIWPWVIHRHRSLWPNPDRFDHTRFAPQAKARQHRFQFIPFGGGPRVCVGARFATVEALLILARWLAARRFSVPPGWRPDPYGSVTLRPRGGIILRAELLA
ncbi:cytochrome P450 [Novosphingobium sp. Gsoil 351]|uniref:cytochrome P450 n=1 Tax=Novosphingobium sp. Gsoil 351 TaxID=2675225 RepID=UPI0018A7F3C6|nr:cytochrome P450 [Novosphingobium sp. Gsoil 351]